MKSLNILVVLFLFCLQLNAQNITFQQIISDNGDGTSTVQFNATNSSTTTIESLGGFTIYYYYDNTQTTVNTTDFSLTTSPNPAGLGFGFSNEVIENNIPRINPLVRVSVPEANAFFYYQNFMNNGGTSNGFLMNPSTSVTLGFITFNHSIGGSASGNGYLSSTAQDSPIRYLNYPGPIARPIVVTGPQFGPLPIKLTVFDAVKYNATSAKIDWKSAKEINSDFYDLERSEDGLAWSKVTTIKAARNSNASIDYSYIDSNLPGTRTSNKIFYYRLKMVDLDGSFAYSDVRGVNFTRSKVEEFLTVYPSPTTNRLNIDLSSFTLDKGDITLEMYDNLGKRVLNKEIIGTGIELIDVSNLPSSVFVIKVIQDHQIYTKQFVKVD